MHIEDGRVLGTLLAVMRDWPEFKEEMRKGEHASTSSVISVIIGDKTTSSQITEWTPKIEALLEIDTPEDIAYRLALLQQTSLKNPIQYAHCRPAFHVMARCLQPGKIRDIMRLQSVLEGAIDLEDFLSQLDPKKGAQAFLDAEPSEIAGVLSMSGIRDLQQELIKNLQVDSKGPEKLMNCFRYFMNCNSLIVDVKNPYETDRKRKDLFFPMYLAVSALYIFQEPDTTIQEIISQLEEMINLNSTLPPEVVNALQTYPKLWEALLNSPLLPQLLMIEFERQRGEVKLLYAPISSGTPAPEVKDVALQGSQRSREWTAHAASAPAVQEVAR